MGVTRRGSLDRRVICRAALALIDDGGLEAFSMRKLGRRLGVEAMSLYNHVTDKSALLDGVVAEIFAELTVPVGPVDCWDDELALLMAELRRAYLRHPNALPILGTRPPSGPEVAPMIQRALAVLAAAGVAEREAIYVLDVCGVFTLGHCLSEVGPQPFGAAEPAVTTDPAARSAAFASAPSVVAAYATIRSTFSFDDQFALGVRLLIEGLRSHTAGDRSDDPSAEGTTDHG